MHGTFITPLKFRALQLVFLKLESKAAARHRTPFLEGTFLETDLLNALLPFSPYVVDHLLIDFFLVPVLCVRKFRVPDPS